MILSIPKYVVNINIFPENKLFKYCLHGELSEDWDKSWMKEGSISMTKLVEAFRGNQDCRLKDLELMTEFQHTGRSVPDKKN